MGAYNFVYVVQYQEDVQAALTQLREREFRAGRYRPAAPDSGIGGSGVFPVPHQSIEELEADMPYMGTGTILDFNRVADAPTDEFGVVGRMDDARLADIFGTATPSRGDFDADPYHGFGEDIERGEAFWFILYRDGRPNELVFAGCSGD